jgi:hypothetical protein
MQQTDGESKLNSDEAAAYEAESRRAGQACLDAGLEYLGLGWSSLTLCPPDHVGVGKTHGKECKHPGKAPWGEWKAFQTTLPTATQLRKKWKDNPFLNVGVAMGGVTGLVGIDIDGEAGEELLTKLSKGDLPDTLEFGTGKGRRLLYRVPEGVELKTTPKPGGLVIGDGEVRLLGTGSQTVMPPSRHCDSGRRYAWKTGHAPGEIEPALAPGWLIELMRKNRSHNST